jgi:hypothetical protein
MSHVRLASRSCLDGTCEKQHHAYSYSRISFACKLCQHFGTVVDPAGSSAGEVRERHLAICFFNLRGSRLMVHTEHLSTTRALSARYSHPERSHDRRSSLSGVSKRFVLGLRERSPPLKVPRGPDSRGCLISTRAGGTPRSNFSAGNTS